MINRNNFSPWLVTGVYLGSLLAGCGDDGEGEEDGQSTTTGGRASGGAGSGGRVSSGGVAGSSIPFAGAGGESGEGGGGGTDSSSPVPGIAGSGGEAGFGDGNGTGNVDGGIKPCSLRPCLNGGTCEPVDDGFTCSCPAGYVGDLCESDLDECATDNGGCGVTSCTNTLGGRVCGPCEDGYEAGPTLGTCVDVDECAVENGGCDRHVICSNTAGGRNCGPCPDGYTGDGATLCKDVNECAAPGACGNLMNCSNTQGGFSCSDCPPGYLDTEFSCVDIDECQTDNGGCDLRRECFDSDGSFKCGPCMESIESGAFDCLGDNECSELADNCDMEFTCEEDDNVEGSYDCLCVEDTTACGSTCCDDASQACSEGTCVNVGALGISLTWDVVGDGDLYVRTPTGKLIYYGNTGPNAGTDNGFFDLDDTTMGPENVYWEAGDVPPGGTYAVCFDPFDIPDDYIVAPTVNVTAAIRMPGQMEQLLQSTRSTSVTMGPPECNDMSAFWIGNFDYYPPYL